MQASITDYLTTMQLEDILSLITISLTCIGGVGALFQWDRTNKINRAKYINELTDKIRSDDDIRETLYKLEYDEKWYSQNFYNSGEPELKLDKTLSYFSYICYLRHMKIISEKEFSFFKYQIRRLLGNAGMQGYLFNLHHFSNHIGTPMTFHYLLEYGNKHEMFPASFFNKDSNEYEKKLNF
jgi:hypothetical protein